MQIIGEELNEKETGSKDHGTAVTPSTPEESIPQDIKPIEVFHRTIESKITHVQFSVKHY